MGSGPRKTIGLFKNNEMFIPIFDTRIWQDRHDQFALTGLLVVTEINTVPLFMLGEYIGETYLQDTAEQNSSLPASNKGPAI